MTEFTSFRDLKGNKIYSDSLVTDSGVSASGLKMPLVWSLVCKVDSEYGIYNISGDFLPFKTLGTRYINVKIDHAGDSDLLKHKYAAKKSLCSYCNYCMGDGKAADFVGLKARVEPNKLIIDTPMDDGFLTYEIEIKACPFCGRRFEDSKTDILRGEIYGIIS